MHGGGKNSYSFGSVLLRYHKQICLILSIADMGYVHTLVIVPPSCTGSIVQLLISERFQIYNCVTDG